MDDTTFLATWDNTGDVGVVYLTKTELKEFATSTGSDKGEHLTSMLKITFLMVSCVLSEVRREVQMETDDFVFKLSLRFDICCVASEEMRVPEIEDPSMLCHRSMCHAMKLGHYLTCGTDYAAGDREEIFRIVLELSDDMPDKVHLLDNCGVQFLRSFLGNTGKMEDIDNCILAFESAVHLTPQGRSEMSGRLKMLGLALYHRFTLRGDLTDISEAITHQQKALPLFLEGHPDIPGLLSNLGNSLMLRFGYTGVPTDISDALSYQQMAIHLTPEGSADYPDRLNNLGIAFRTRFERTGDLTDISDSITYQQKAVHLTPEGEDLPRRLNNLGMVLQSRFELTREPADISDAVSYQQKAVHFTPEGHEDMPGHLNNLGRSLAFRFKLTGDLTDISNAISYQQEAVHLTPEGHANMPGYLTNLGNSYLNRFLRTGELTDIFDGISYQKKAVHLIPDGQADIPALLSNLGGSFQCLFTRTGDLAHISDAISYLQKAVHLTPEGHAFMPQWLNNLGSSFQSRFECTGDLADNSDAILYLQKALHLTPEGHGDIPTWLTNLGNAFQSRFQCIGHLANISEAISHQQKAVYLTHETHAGMPNLLNNLGISFSLRFKHTGDLADASDAISYHQKAIHLTPEGHVDMPAWLNNLGNAFQDHYICTGDLADISNAISYQQKAIHLTPEGHANMPGYLTNLGKAFQDRFKYTGDPTDAYALLSTDRRCAIYSSGPPLTRLKAAIRWAQYSFYDPLQSLEAYDTAIQLVSQVAGLEQTIQKRHTNLVEISDLAASAVAHAIKLGRPELALEWLEQGRCLIWSQLNNLRTPLDALFAHDPEIAHDMLRVSRGLENAGSRGNLASQSQGEATMEHRMSLQEEANTHVKLAKEWNELLTKIRTIPKFEDFLQPPSCSNLLKNLPESGLVVVINVHEDSCDALGLLSKLDEPLHIPLQKFSYAKATDLRNQLNTHLCAANVRIRESKPDAIRATCPVGDNNGSSVIKHILHQLWILVVKPILDGLGFSVSISVMSK